MAVPCRGNCWRSFRSFYSSAAKRSIEPRGISPRPAVAEQAVKAGMESWKNGEPEGVIAGTKPVVRVVDSYRKEGHPIANYEILGQVPGNAARCFAVKVELKDSGGTVKIYRGGDRPDLGLSSGRLRSTLALGPSDGTEK